MSQPSRAAVISAFTAVYLVWGSTYLGIRFAIETMPPFLMAGSRFLLAGLVLYAVARFRGAARPVRADWKRATIIGAALILCGNGGVTFGELYVPSALTALLIAMVPVFMAVLGWLSGITARPTRVVWLGLACGLAGVALLVRPDPAALSHPRLSLGVGIILTSALIWSAGSLYAGRTTSRTTPFASAGMQMICGGALQLLAGFAFGEHRGFDITAVSAQSWLAWLYLIVFGAIVGYTAYSWLLLHCPPAQVATYAYVNPVVAVLLGATLGGEKMTPGMIAGAALIVAAVAAVIAKQSRASRLPAPMQDPEPARVAGRT
jgi:drug/metabolite transporter (DMT)-like permease